MYVGVYTCGCVLSVLRMSLVCEWGGGGGGGGGACEFFYIIFFID